LSMALELRRCPSCGRKRLVSVEFGRCFECEADYIVTGKAPAKPSESLAGGEAMPKKNENGTKEKTDSPTLTLDFSEYPEIYERLRRAARADFRTPELQVLWLLDQNLPKAENL